MKIDGLTLGQHVTLANKQAAWLKKLCRLLKPMTKGAVAKLFTVSQDSMVFPENGEAKVVLTYCGEAKDLDAYMLDVRKVENVFDTRFNDFGEGALSAGRSSLVLKLQSQFDVQNIPNDDEWDGEEPDGDEYIPVSRVAVAK